LSRWTLVGHFPPSPLEKRSPFSAAHSGSSLRSASACVHACACVCVTHDSTFLSRAAVSPTWDALYVRTEPGELRWDYSRVCVFADFGAWHPLCQHIQAGKRDNYTQLEIGGCCERKNRCAQTAAAACWERSHRAGRRARVNRHSLLLGSSSMASNSSLVQINSWHMLSTTDFEFFAGPRPRLHLFLKSQNKGFFFFSSSPSASTSH